MVVCRTTNKGRQRRHRQSVGGIVPEMADNAAGGKQHPENWASV